ncbi:fumarate reductase subunit A [Clostridia bacterium]|nr:fumarate reductase subunit A [Clostridia bacterium]
MKTIQTDLLVIGGGLSGLTAADTAAAYGVRALVVRDGRGASPWVHGFNAPLSPEDSVEAFMEDTLRCGYGLGEPELVRALCENGTNIVETLEHAGLRFNRDAAGTPLLLRPLGSRYPRVASVGNETGIAIIRSIEASAEGRFDILENSRAIALRTVSGHVRGALVYDTLENTMIYVAASTVVLAAGGFCGIYPFTTNKQDSSGDGIAMAFRAGAPLIDVELIQFEPSAAIYPPALRGTSVITTMLYEGAVLRNGLGDRFMLHYSSKGERANKDALARAMAIEIRADRASPHGGIWFDATGVGAERLRAVYPMYVERYAHVGIDLSKEPIEVAPAPHTALGGVRIDPHCATAVARLYVCGEAAGGIHGANRIGGNAGLETLVFGGRAGKSAAEYARAVPADDSGGEAWAADELGSLSGVWDTVRADTIRAELEEILTASVGVLREGAKLIPAREKLESLAAEARALSCSNEREAFYKIRLCNDVLAGLLLVTGALAREESVGCHVRLDFPRPASLPSHVILRNHNDNGIALTREAVGG